MGRPRGFELMAFLYPPSPRPLCWCGGSSEGCRGAAARGRGRRAMTDGEHQSPSVVYDQHLAPEGGVLHKYATTVQSASDSEYRQAMPVSTVRPFLCPLRRRANV